MHANHGRVYRGSNQPLQLLVDIKNTGAVTYTELHRGVGPMPAAPRALLHEFVRLAHRNGQRVRFWATPDVPGAARTAVWRELVAADVDHINTDDLAGLQESLRTCDPTAGPGAA